jgi:7,8-dihydropterin-6-yl-methyl-4-(beta-D-ribofuranosyl)aminobenzene 5'-phosphate synthase
LERLTITVVTDNYYDALRPDNYIAVRYRTTPGASLHAEHGLSYFIETVTDGSESAFMFDYGVDGAGVSNNMRLLDIDVGTLNAFALSHGHFDHWGGLVKILKRNGSFIHKVLPLYGGKDAFAHRFTMRLPGVLTDIGKLDQRKLEGTETVRIVEIDKPTEIVPGAYLSGPIERMTDYERVPPHLLIERGGDLQHDQFEGELAIAFVIKGKGLVVHLRMRSCRHRQYHSALSKANRCGPASCRHRRFPPDRLTLGGHRADGCRDKSHGSRLDCPDTLHGL